MKPSSEQGVILELDRISELKVVLDATEDTHFMRNYSVPVDHYNYSQSTPGRFREETRETITYQTRGDKPGFVQLPEWKIGARFKVLESDANFVSAAAKRVLSEEDKVERAWNWITRRTRAAKSIVAALIDN